MSSALLFDWTGTLVDEYDLDKDVCRRIEFLISKNRGISIDQARKIYRDLLESFEGTWKWFDYSLHGKELDINWKEAHLSTLHRIRLLPGAIEALELGKRRNHKICLLTNASEEVIRLRLDYLGIRSLFDLVVESDLVKSTKSSGKHLQLAMDRLDFEPQLSFSIGDDYSEDIAPAKRAKTRTVLCRLGDKKVYYHSNKSSKSPALIEEESDYVIHHLFQLKDIV